MKDEKIESQIILEKQEKKRLREEIENLINHVPPSVLSGSVQVARAWKLKAVKAMKLSKRNQSKIEDLRNIVNDLKSFLS